MSAASLYQLSRQHLNPNPAVTPTCAQGSCSMQPCLLLYLLLLWSLQSARLELNSLQWL
jgi:hypothetical protein